MKTVLLAGGRGTRIGEESQFRPKPMIEIGGRPILWHIMKIYAFYGLEDFVICCGYKGHMIKEYFINYHQKYSNLRIHLDGEAAEYFNPAVEPWRVTMINTGLKTPTAGRVLKLREYMKDEEEFCLTYGDGVADVDICKLLEFHHDKGKIATITITRPAGRFGAVHFDKETKEVQGFKEKARIDQPYVNIGFMVCSRRIFDYLGDGSEMLEAGPFERLVAAGEMAAYEHSGFWSPMDSLKDKTYLEYLWNGARAPWIMEEGRID